MTNLSAIAKETFIGKLLRAPLRLIPSRTVLPVLQGPLRGKKWIAGSATHGCWLGSYEYEKQSAIQLALNAGDVFYDIGANVGFYSLLSSVLVGRRGHVYSFEPAPDNIWLLRRHLEMNGITNCTVIEAAVSSMDGESAFDPSADRCTGHLNTAGKLCVRTLTLDHAMGQLALRPPTLLKIDIEGAENECLKGASRVIHEFRPVIFVATHGPRAHSDCLDLLSSWKYRVQSLDARSLDQTDELVAYPGE